MLLLLSQAVRYLIDPTVDEHDKQLLKRELSSELVSWLINFIVIASMSCLSTE